MDLPRAKVRMRNWTRTLRTSAIAGSGRDVTWRSINDMTAAVVSLYLAHIVCWSASVREQSTDRVQIQLDGVAENFLRVLARPSSRSDPRGDR